MTYIYDSDTDRTCLTTRVPQEEGEYEETAYHPGARGQQEAHDDEGLLYQPLGDGLDNGGEESKLGGRRDVAGGCPSTHDPCYKEVHGGHGNPNMGGTGSGCWSGRRSGGKCVTGNEGGGFSKSGKDACTYLFWVPPIGWICGLANAGKEIANKAK